jgi:DNA-binding transcriptional LysR family regulator
MHERVSLQDLRTFLVLASRGSFAAAAEHLSRDATSLSRRLQSLEGHLGVRLADRSTRAFVLTEAGRAYLERIGPAIEALDAAGREATALVDGAPRGRLRVALPGSFARRWLDPLIIDFLKAHPNISFEAHYSNSFVDIIAQNFDVAIRLATLSDSRLVARKLAPRRRLVCAAAAYLARAAPLDGPKDIISHSCLCFTGRQEPYRWRFGKSGETLAVMANCYMASDDADLLLAAAQAGLGLFYTTDWHAGPSLASGDLVEVLTDWPVMDDGAIYFVTPAISGMPSKTRAFSDWIAKALATPPWLSGSAVSCQRPGKVA